MGRALAIQPNRSGDVPVFPGALSLVRRILHAAVPGWHKRHVCTFTVEKEMPMPQNNQLPRQQQTPPGFTSEMRPVPDHGEESYKGSGELEGRVAIITGGDSGIGRAVAIAFAREGAHVVISYLNEDEDAESTAELIRQAGCRVLAIPGDITNEEHCQELVDSAISEFGRLDILVNNAAFQRTYKSVEEISIAEWETTLRTNVTAPFMLAKAALKHMKRGASIINTTSIQSRDPSGALLAYATSKGAISNFTAGLAQALADKGIRVNAVAPGPIWTPLIPSTMPPEKVETFGSDTPLGRVGQPAELAGAYVLLASDAASYMTGAVIAVTGGEIMI
jgi:NAD(P)-dependent dehydrogenase (short-subunit alcohol dehydrogenase family)